MSKKKAFSGSTMTLKDFHGGSIPSDLPLPSAPGATVRPSDRSGFDRQIPTAWGSPMGRSDHRPRPGSSGATRTFDEKASFLSHPAHIGRNFDEDERKPLDGISAPRRTVSDDSAHVAPIRPEPKSESLLAGKFSGRPTSPSPARFTTATSVGVNFQNQSRNNNGQNLSSSYPNAWGIRKDVVNVTEPVSSSGWSGPTAVSRFAQASALEKVSSGRWQSKHSIPDIEVIRFSEMETDFSSKDNNAYNGIAPVIERVDYDVIQGKFSERVLVAEDGVWSGGNDVLDNERARSTIHAEATERNSSFYLDGVRPASAEGKFCRSNSQLQVPKEVLERPKLKLLPRSKPLETSEHTSLDYKQGFQQRPLSGHFEAINESHANANPPKLGSAGGEGVNQAVERPKLNLKPRSRPNEQLERNVEKERKGLFGGARPRELVLKERGDDDVTVNYLDVGQPINRIKHGEKAENFPLDRRNGRDSERNDTEKADMQSSRLNELQRNSIEREKQQRPVPDTWRKPVEQPKPAQPNTSGPRFGKSASAMELAQAFSRSMSDAKSVDRLPGQRGMPSRSQIPFSRLTETREFYAGSTPRHQINGY